jgi:hypothetical protein
MLRKTGTASERDRDPTSRATKSSAPRIATSAKSASTLTQRGRHIRHGKGQSCSWLHASPGSHEWRPGADAPVLLEDPRVKNIVRRFRSLDAFWLYIQGQNSTYGGRRTDLATVSKVLGHSNIATMAIYAHVMPSMELAVADRMDAAVGSSRYILTTHYEGHSWSPMGTRSQGAAPERGLAGEEVSGSRT